MSLSKNILPFAIAVGIVAAAVALPAIIFGADRYAAPTTAGHAEEGMRCNSRQTECTIITYRVLKKPHIALYTRDVCPGAKPDITEIDKIWHSRYLCRGVLKETRFSIIRRVK